MDVLFIYLFMHLFTKSLIKGDVCLKLCCQINNIFLDCLYLTTFHSSFKHELKEKLPTFLIKPSDFLISWVGGISDKKLKKRIKSQTNRSKAGAMGEVPFILVLGEGSARTSWIARTKNRFFYVGKKSDRMKWWLKNVKKNAIYRFRHAVLNLSLRFRAQCEYTYFVFLSVTEGYV